MVEILTHFKFPKEWGFVRTPTRPKDLWVFDFEKNYDWDTIWNDAIQISSDTIMLVGPPLYGTANWLRDNCWFGDSSHRPLEWEIIELDRVCLTIVKVPNWTKSIKLVSRLGVWSIDVNTPSNDFLNKKVIVTISKNHPIAWLKEWIDYHKQVHNVDGILLYNNQSTDYTTEELAIELKRSDIVIKVIDYDVPFGCMGGGDWEWQGKSGNYLPWDSDFSQYVMLEHAKRRYLHCAKLAINADTDELLYFKNNLTLDQVAEHCQTSNNSVWLYSGTWIEPVNSKDGIIAKTIDFNTRRFSDYWHTNYSDQRGIGIKWMLNPEKNMQYQWHLHKTFGPHMSTNEIGFAHYLAMNTSWSWDRDGYSGDQNSLTEFDPIKQNLMKWNKQ